MYQTLIAVGALAITITFALSTQQAQIRVDEQKIHTEVETLAGQVATDMLGHISIQEFDDRTRDRVVNSPDQLTPASAFPNGRRLSACDDVDDFHRMQTQVVPVLGGDLTFDVDASVQYVDVDGTPSSSRTYQKEVTVTVIDTPQGGRSVLPAPIEMREIITWP